MSRTPPLALAMTLLSLSAACAHQPLAVPTSRAEATGAPRYDGLSAWAQQTGTAIELGTGYTAEGATDRLDTTVQTDLAPTFGWITGALRLAAPVARMFDFETAHSPDGVTTMSRELGPKVLSLHLAPGLLALHWADLGPSN